MKRTGQLQRSQGRRGFAFRGRCPRCGFGNRAALLGAWFSVGAPVDWAWFTCTECDERVPGDPT